MLSIFSMFSAFSMFSMFSQLTPCLPIRDGRMEQFVEPWHVWHPRSATKTALSPKFGLLFWKYEDIETSVCVHIQCLHIKGRSKKPDKKPRRPAWSEPVRSTLGPARWKWEWAGWFRSNQKLVFPFFLPINDHEFLGNSFGWNEKVIDWGPKVNHIERLVSGYNLVIMKLFTMKWFCWGISYWFQSSVPNFSIHCAHGIDS